jgi:CRP-like cAMP-binding protein
MVEFTTLPNRILADLSPADLRLIEPYLQKVELREGARLRRFGEPLDQVLFPHDCLISITAAMEDGKEVECAIIGAEGIAHAYAGFGVDYAITDSVVQIAGSATQISVVDFRRILRQSESLREHAARCDALLMAQMHQSAACNALHEVEARMCRWLLEIDDRSRGGRFPMKQELLARMLGVRRTTVTLVAKRLQQAGAFRWRRGYVHVLRRDLIVDRSCGCYERLRLCAERMVREPSRQQAKAERDLRAVASPAH